MYLYFDSQGILKEIINDLPFRQASYDVNFIYVYVDGINARPNSIEYKYGIKTLEGYEVLPYYSEYEWKENEEVPYNPRRDLKFFKYYEKYNFIKIPLTYVDAEHSIYWDILANPGTIDLTIIVNGLSLGLVVFNVERGTNGDIELQSDQYISLAQFNYLLYQYKDNTIKTINGIYVEDSYSDANNNLSLRSVGQIIYCKAEQTTYKVIETEEVKSLTPVLMDKSALDLKANSADVYSQSESNTRFAIKEGNNTFRGLNTFASYLPQSELLANNPYDLITLAKALVLQNESKGYVDEKIAELQAKSDVIDVLGNIAELEAYDTEEVAENDIINVLSDSEHENASTFYKLREPQEGDIIVEPTTPDSRGYVWVYIGEEGPFLTPNEADSKYQTKIIGYPLLNIAINDWAQDQETGKWYYTKVVSATDLTIGANDKYTLGGNDDATSQELGECNINPYSVTTSGNNTTITLVGNFKPTIPLNVSIVIAKVTPTTQAGITFFSTEDIDYNSFTINQGKLGVDYDKVRTGLDVYSKSESDARYVQKTDIADSSNLGLVKSTTTGTTANRDYNVEVNNDGTMKVNVPWTDNGAQLYLHTVIITTGGTQGTFYIINNNPNQYTNVTFIQGFGDIVKNSISAKVSIPSMSVVHPSPVLLAASYSDSFTVSFVGHPQNPGATDELTGFHFYGGSLTYFSDTVTVY